MLVRDLGMVLYAESSRWRAPEDRKLTKNEASELAKEPAARVKIDIELAFADGTEIIRGK